MKDRTEDDKRNTVLLMTKIKKKINRKGKRRQVVGNNNSECR